MRFLVVGGTGFLGRQVAEAARDAGHEVTVFHRGRMNAAGAPGVRSITGSRDEGLEGADGDWDVVVDTCGYLPQVVQVSLDALVGRVGRYVFVSSISVHDLEAIAAAGVPEGRSGRFVVETSPVQAPPAEILTEVRGESYGALKVACEERVVGSLGNRALLVRPGLIVGPEDGTDRFTYWAHRISHVGRSRGREPVLVPDDPHAPVQFVDVRDLASWIVTAAVEGRSGPYSVTGPGAPLEFGDFLDRAARSLEVEPEFLPVAEADLLEAEVTPFLELPLWVPRSSQHFMRVCAGKAVADGLTFRPLEETVRDTAAWAAGKVELKAGMSADRERALIAHFGGESG